MNTDELFDDFDVSLKQENMLDESGGLSRLLSHINSRSLGIISACRANPDPLIERRENNQRTAELKNDIRDSQFGFVNVIGTFLENEGKPNQKLTKEKGFLVIGAFNDTGRALKNFLIKEGNKFGQDAILYKSFQDDQAYLYYPDHVENVGTFHPQKIGDYYTSLRGKKFTFTTVNEERGFLSRWGASVAHERELKERNNQK